MMAYKDRPVSLLGRLDKPIRTLEVIRDRLLQQHRDSGLDRNQATRDMHAVGGGQDDAVRAGPLESDIQIREVRNSQRVGLLPCLRRRIDDRRKFRPRLLEYAFDVLLANETCAGNGDS